MSTALEPIVHEGTVLVFDGQVWAPVRFTAPLRPDFVTDGDRLIALAERHFRYVDDDEGVHLIRLDDWQKTLIRHILERYPDDWPVAELRGQLRYRQVVVSMGRQNGKSLIGALLALYGLLQHVKAPMVVGVARAVEQAGVIYTRVEDAVRLSPELSRRLKATTTRGIRKTDRSGRYVLKPSLDEGLQSIPVTLVLADELHLTKPAMWDSVVTGQRSRRNALVAGITTAGDSSSVLLKRLYEQGDEAIAGQREQFGFFLWEAPAGSTLDTPGAVEAANPAVACGRIPLGRVLGDERGKPEPDIKRYTLNQFVAASTTWLPLPTWRARAGTIPDGDDVVFAISKTPSWEYLTITATHKAADGRLYTEVAASLVRPTRDRLIAVCQQLVDHPSRRATFAMESATLSAVGKALRDLGHDVWILTQNEMCQASAAAWSVIDSGTMTHAGDAIVTAQMPYAQRINTGESWRVTNRGTHHVDAVLATIIGLHVAREKQPATLQLF